ncbi:hypothetical protein RHGRI_003237 [Rhododendron griersonianum]|uniref:AB hydrolase-1 domain-containing protein n=1 Tax=Rhododendron griersonianum TaxID=479676 RepID=A0AAV6L510_9ERIC|nr:hypothetical protein RHGRI_003237 [Rhododendron griersonianum]
METIEHKTITANGMKIHIAEKGQGPLVLFLHGFPELWYSWRHQILYMAAQGYRAVAPDLRGYGDTTGAPVHDCTKFTSLHVGAFMAWSLCLYRPDRVKALVNLSVHFMPRDPVMKPIAMFRGLFGDDHYMCRFQVPGDIEAEFAQIGARDVVKKFLTYRDPGTFYFPKGKGFGSFPDTPDILPSWLSEEDVDYYTNKFEKNGFTGGINYYRAFDLNWELTGPWTGTQVKVPTKFIVGDLDLVYNIPGVKEYVQGGGFKKYVPLLDEVVVMEGVAHFLNQEKPDEINQYILEYIKKF